MSLRSEPGDEVVDTLRTRYNEFLERALIYPTENSTAGLDVGREESLSPKFLQATMFIMSQTRRPEGAAPIVRPRVNSDSDKARYHVI